MESSAAPCPKLKAFRILATGRDSFGQSEDFYGAIKSGTDFRQPSLPILVGVPIAVADAKTLGRTHVFIP